MSVATEDLLYRLKHTKAAVTVSISGTSARNGSDLGPGAYLITSDVDCFFLQGSSSVTATTSSPPLWGKSYFLVFTDSSADARIAFITSGGTGTAYIIPKCTD